MLFYCKYCLNLSVTNPLTSTAMIRAIKEIEKESVPTLRFPNEEVLTSKEAKVNRMLCLKRASVLGNIDHTKMKIIFKDSDGVKKVNTTVFLSTLLKPKARFTTTPKIVFLPATHCKTPSSKSHVIIWVAPFDCTIPKHILTFLLKTVQFHRSTGTTMA